MSSKKEREKKERKQKDISKKDQQKIEEERKIYKERTVGLRGKYQERYKMNE